MDARIQKIIERWYINEPAFFQIIGTHDLEENSKLSCPFRCGRGKIEYNPTIIDSLDDSKLLSYLKAEIIRILLKHPYERQPDGCKRESMSVGSNLVLSDNYDFSDIQLPKPEQYNLKPSESYEWYSYRIEELSDDPVKKTPSRNNQEPEGDGDNAQNKQSLDSNQNDEDKEGINDNNGNPSDNNNSDSSDLDNNGSGDGNSSDGEGSREGNSSGGEGSGEGNPSGGAASGQGASSGGGGLGGGTSFSGNRSNQSDVLKELSELWEEDTFLSCTIDAVIDEIESSNSWGSLAGNMASKIVANTKAKIDYRKVLAGFRASVLSTKRKLTRMRPNRRTGFDNMGSIRRFDTNILIAVDVSGSISSESLRHFYSIIRRAFKYGVEKLDVVQFDVQLGEIESFDKASLKVKKPIEIIGRGGTNFQAIFDFVVTHPEYDGLIIFTDGIAPVPTVHKGTKCKVVWVCDSKDNYEHNNKWMRSIGRCCVVEV